MTQVIPWSLAADKKAVGVMSQQENSRSRYQLPLLVLIEGIREI